MNEVNLYRCRVPQKCLFSSVRVLTIFLVGLSQKCMVAKQFLISASYSNGNNRITLSLIKHVCLVSVQIANANGITKLLTCLFKSDVNLYNYFAFATKLSSFSWQSMYEIHFHLASWPAHIAVFLLCRHTWPGSSETSRQDWTIFLRGGRLPEQTSMEQVDKISSITVVSLLLITQIKICTRKYHF